MKENSIEKDIKILETFLDRNKCCNGCEIVCADCYIDYEEVQAIKHILSEYQMILKENEKLNTKILSNAGIYQLGLKDGEKQIAPKIKDKIEELNKLLADIDYKDIEDKQEREFYKKEYYQVVAQLKVLGELLEEGGRNNYEACSTYKKEMV